MPRSTRTTGGRHPETSREIDTQSLTASVTDYPVENGRTYHKYHEGSYVYPNDEREMDRLDMQHHMCKILTGGRLFFAPLIHPRRILDLGTGSGIWPIELASIFPESQITGTDLSPCQPTEVPENVHFIVDDITEDEWLFNHNTLDYIHAGHLSGALPSFRDLLRKMYNHLVPGGWAECHEFDTMVKCDDGTMPPLDEDKIGPYHFQDWCDLQIRSGQASDPPRQFRVAHRLARGMRDMGFVDVHERILKAPVNPWSPDHHLREIGRWNESNILEALSGWSYKPLTALAWSKPEIEVFLVEVRKSVQNHHVHAYFNFHIIVGRKPHPGEQNQIAYRHTLPTSSNPFIDHVWISDQLLASTFQRFANGQRRYESRVPGPLEARRRLAKRRNTALASVAGSGPLDDIACLLGRNGREHMKWSESPGRSLDNHFFPSNPSPSPISFDNGDLDPIESGNPLVDWPGVGDGSEKVTRDRFFGEQLREYRKTSDLKDAIRALNIDIRQEPVYSRLILDHLVSRWAPSNTTINELLSFLDDPHLNITGAGNYLGAVEHYISREVRFKEWHSIFDSIIRALRLGVIPSEEISALLRSLSGLDTDKPSAKILTQLYRSMWDAIGSCDIYGHRDLDAALFDTWLGLLLNKGTPHDFLLAKDILLAADQAVSVKSLWVQKFINRWLEDPIGSRSHLDGEHVIKFLKPFDADLVSHSVVHVTEALVSSKKTRLLQRWASCSARLHNASAIASSHVWTHVRVYHNSSSHRAPTSARHRIIQRLWLLHSMNISVQRRHPTIVSLYRLYDQARRENNIDLWTSLTKGIHDIHLPWNNWRALIDDLRTREPTTDTSEQFLEKYDSSPLSFAEIFADQHAYNAAAPLFFNNIAKMICRTNITSPAFQEHAMHIARTGDPTSVWTLVRFLRSHTPLKIALSRSWHRLDPSDKALIPYHQTPRIALQPDPHDSLELIHSLATAFACSAQFSPRRAYKLVHWLYVFLYKHGAPVRPPLVRALYHAGVYEYIWNIVQEAERPEVVQAVENRTPVDLE
ncbi:hypothetical protein BDW59DRAFT_176054 [Aspergillus cavernicola]|uniref:Methyltransferase domain-containing protein n=1 Tax=Aspergillus cavernicola TaxID=176166 RepID=A0ABR4HK81_9EURO